MREDWPSSTASIVALARAVASLPRSGAPVSDPIATSLVRFPFGRAVEMLAPAAERTTLVPRALRVASFGMVDHIALRTAAIDDAVKGMAARGIKQLVILGAGLDARAWRMDELEPVRVFEVDHPATQRWKRAHTEGRDPIAREVRFVAVDFHREQLDARLAEEGHDASAKTGWIWEGVTMYLEAEAIRATLESTAQRSAPGSQMAVTYYAEHMLLTMFRRPVDLAFRVIGEPLRHVTTRERFASLANDAGWSVREDSGTQDWSERYGFGSSALLWMTERLALLER